MKKILLLLTVCFLFALGTKVYADDSHHDSHLSCENPHKNTVACYLTGPHAIVGESVLHYGYDLVWRNDDRPDSYNFTQYFKGQGEYAQEWEISHWNYIGTSAECRDSGILIQNAKESGWGDYFPAHSNYCVHNEEHEIRP